MGLLSPPSDEILVVARALIYHPDVLPSVSDDALERAIQQVTGEMDEDYIARRERIKRGEAKPHTVEAFEYALAQRISSARLALSAAETEAVRLTAAASKRSTNSRRPR